MVNTYIHPEPASWSSQFLQTVMRLIQWKKQPLTFLTGKRLMQQPAKMPRYLSQNYNINTTTHNGREVYTITPQKPVSKKVILYWHGGAYVHNITLFHWNLVAALVKQTGATLILPDYPLAPAATWQDVYHFAQTLYQQLLIQTPANQIVFMGDSAGGGLALGLTQKLHSEQLPIPPQTILLAPWLDISMTNPLINQIEPHDAMLHKQTLLMAANAYANQLPLQDYKVSPLYGSFDGLGTLSVFTGTHDLLLADARKLKQMAEQQTFALNYFEYPKMFHVWMAITQLPESKHAIQQIARLIEK
ncbi:MAG TPA: alpha/beta hydrolase [Chitinophagales bacterium]|nr:alpha/beta hydrolase [Chitinophagales bacterium]HRK28163.1 alpha/beta hydrolase [Chitinophagales bacterium]